MDLARHELLAGGVGDLSGRDISGDTRPATRVFGVFITLDGDGGTGVYRNVRGQATFDFRRSDRVTVSYELIP